MEGLFSLPRGPDHTPRLLVWTFPEGLTPDNSETILTT